MDVQSEDGPSEAVVVVEGLQIANIDLAPGWTVRLFFGRILIERNDRPSLEQVLFAEDDVAANDRLRSRLQNSS